MKKLKIAQVSPLWYPVPPKGYGGTELVVHRLAEQLIKMGHRVTVFASGNSKTNARLVSVIKTNLRKLGVPYLQDSYNILNLIEAFSQEDNFDIIHTHIDVYDPVFRSFSKKPTVATLHNPFWPLSSQNKTGAWYAYRGRVDIYNRFPRLPYISISDKYKELCPAKINFAKTIYHGIEVNSFKLNRQPKKNTFVWLGRITRTKGLHVAVKLARELKFNLNIAGAFTSPEDEKYFDTEIKPYLNKKINFVGVLKTDKEKAQFLGDGQAPSLSTFMGRAFRYCYGRINGLRHAGYCFPEGIRAGNYYK
ncbi:MAG: glycosyltransferase [bacterium]